MGDAITINLDTGLGVHGHYYVCYYPDGSPYDCFNTGAEATVSVDPFFGFDQADFTGNYNLSDYYGLSFSPNVSITPAPEPSSLLLVGTSLLIFAPLLCRRFGRICR
ncbi:MAG TPA: PEP-CTERM sorting domain-containing protein [Bryobacteraceae bacterium]|nr:PEP-CTERM sorting domain-containing protein [Bryobacteraceae bacterium]